MPALTLILPPELPPPELTRLLDDLAPEVPELLIPQATRPAALHSSPLRPVPNAAGLPPGAALRQALDAATGERILILRDPSAPAAALAAALDGPILIATQPRAAARGWRARLLRLMGQALLGAADPDPAALALRRRSWQLLRDEVSEDPDGLALELRALGAHALEALPPAGCDARLRLPWRSLRAALWRRAPWSLALPIAALAGLIHGLIAPLHPSLGGLAGALLILACGRGRAALLYGLLGWLLAPAPLLAPWVCAAATAFTSLGALARPAPPLAPAHPR